MDRGSLGVRSWGRLLADLGQRRFTGTVRVESLERELAIGFVDGTIVAATSPMPADAALRVAIKQRIVPASRSGAINQALVHAGERDAIEVIAAAAQLAPDDATRLRARVIAQRAARTFELEEGVYVIHDTAPAEPHGAVDVREVVYLGARLFAPALRVTRELRASGVSFRIAAEAEALLPRFAFAAAEAPIVDALRRGSSLAELEARHRDVDPRAVQAVLYALVTCGATRDVEGEPADAGSADAARPGFAAGTVRDRNPLAVEAAAPSASPVVPAAPLLPAAPVVPAATTSRTRTNTDRQTMFAPRPRTPAPSLGRAATELAPGAPSPELARAPTRQVLRRPGSDSDAD